MKLHLEQVVLCDQNGHPTGTAEKFSSHHANTPLHLAFSCYVFNSEGKFLVTQRAHSKKVWPGIWTNSVCGHPAPDEDMIDAIKRRLDQELGMTAQDFQLLVPEYIYKTPTFKGVIEHEYCPIYVARAASEVKPNPEEVENYKWMSWGKYVAAAEADKIDEWSWWCKDQLKQLKDHSLIRKFAKSN